MQLSISKLLRLVLVVILFIAPSSQVLSDSLKIYVHTDKDGTLVFSDKPSEGSILVNLNQRHMTMPATDTSILDRLQGNDEANKPQYQIVLDQPDEKATIRDNSGEVFVSGHITPALKFGYRVRLKLDDNVLQKPHGKAVFTLRNIDRGEHKVQLELLDTQGNIISKSEPHTFYMFRTSIFKAR